jgi:uncharacterized repeat protein (TIGR01451 family)
MTVAGASGRLARCHHGRAWRLVAASAMGAVVLTCWWASAAAAATKVTIKVNTTAESARFNTGPGGAPKPPPPNGPHPVYASQIVDLHSNGKCSLREAIEAANTQATVGACQWPGGVSGNVNVTIKLKAGTYHIWDNFFIETKMRFVGPNKGVAGNDPNRRHEAVLEFDYNPDWAGQVAMFWLDTPADTGDARGAGTVFDGVEMRGAFVPDCAMVTPCEIAAIVQPSRIDQPGYTVTNSILRDFSYAVYLGGRDTITRDLFEDNNQNPAATADGWDIYADEVYTSHDTIIDDNVFKNPVLGGVILQNGNGDRTTVSGEQIEHNLFLKEVNSDLGVFLLQTSGVVIKDNLFYHPDPVPLADRGDTAIRMDLVDHVQVLDNTITDWGTGIKLGGIPLPGPSGSTDDTISFNRIYDNRYGVQVTAQDGPITPLSVDATDNWWGSNGGPGSTGARPGALNPVNGLQFFDSNGNPVPDPNGVTVAPWLHLTCRVPATVEVNVPAPVVGQDVGMPTVDVTGSTEPWFYDHHDPFMAASAPGLGTVFGFDQVPDQGPNNAQLTGTLVATHTGRGDVLVDLDSEQVACPFTATPGTEAGIDKTPDRPTVTAGSLAGYRITVTNRSRRAARNWWACDRMPRGMTFVRATAHLRRLGRLRCLVIPTLGPHQRVSFHVTAHVAANAPGTLTNEAEVIPGLPTAGTPPPPAAESPIAKVGAKQKVTHPATSRRAPTPPVSPPFTG